jgi:drug/metabolite transporter (DMT)-like permease
MSPLQKKDVPFLFILGFIGISMYHVSLNYGEQFISAGAASLIIATIPIFVVILAVIFLKEIISKKIIAGILISVLGVFIITLWGSPDASIEIQYLSGAIAIVFASLVGACYTIAGKFFLKRYSGLSLTTYAFIFGNLGLILFLNKSFFEQVSNLSTSGWIAVLFLAIFPTVIAYTFWYVALQVKPASELTVYLYFTPVLSTLIGFLMLNEALTIFYIFGGFLVIVGLYVVNLQKRNNKHGKMK